MYTKQQALFLGLIVVCALTLSAGQAGTLAAVDEGERLDVVTAVSPVYLPFARAARIQGMAKIEVHVNVKGDVVSAESLSGHPLLYPAAVDAARDWKFTPLKQSNWVRTIILEFTFQLTDPCPEPKELTTRFFPPYRIEVRAAGPCCDCGPCPHGSGPDKE